MTTPPRCRYCGGPIAKRVRTVWIESLRGKQFARPQDTDFYRTIYTADPPKTKTDCQRLSNQQVISVSRSFRDATTISRFSEWNGESYEDALFCKGEHAKRFGEFAARSGKVATKAYHDAVMKDLESV